MEMQGIQDSQIILKKKIGGLTTSYFQNLLQSYCNPDNVVLA
jgi:hypothetical protein